MKSSSALRFSSAFVLASCAFAASAQISVVPTAFTGAYSENFESFSSTTGLASATVMGGQLTLTSPTSQLGVGYNGGWGLGTKGGLNTTSKFGFGNDGSANPFSFTFAQPVGMFGGFFNAASYNPNITFSFYDASNALIGTNVWATPNDSTLDWRGYSSTVGIKRIAFTGGESVPFDNLQANLFVPQATPEPSALAAVGLGAAAMLRRRRK